MATFDLNKQAMMYQDLSRRDRRDLPKDQRKILDDYLAEMNKRRGDYQSQTRPMVVSSVATSPVDTAVQVDPLQRLRRGTAATSGLIGTMGLVSQILEGVKAGRYNMPDQRSQRFQETMSLLDRAQAPLREKEAMVAQESIEKDAIIKGKELSQSTIGKLNEGARLPAALDGIEKIMGQTQDKFGKIKGWKNLAIAKLKGGVADKLNARMAAVRQMYGKLMEGGVLRKEDEKKYKEQFPKMTDTYDVALYKIQSLNAMLKKDIQDGLTRFQKQGYDISGYDDVMEWAVQDPDILESVTAKDVQSTAKSFKYVIGDIYKDANGNRAEYLGKGKWKELK